MRLLMLRNVLAATDLTAASDVAIDAARRLVEASGAKLHVAHVVAPAAPGSPRADVPNADTVIRRSGLTVGEQLIDILHGDPATEISALASRIGADLIVLGHHQTADAPESNAPVGSTAYAVITSSEAPCLVVNQRLELPLECALVATDFSEAARGALLVALSWTSALRSRAPAHVEPKLVALHVDSRNGDVAGARRDTGLLDQELESLRRDAGGWAGVQVRAEARAAADPATAIVECAREDGAQLVVLGTRALTASGGTDLGSISDAVVRKLDIPVLLVPPAVWRDFARDLDAA